MPEDPAERVTALEHELAAARADAAEARRELHAALDRIPDLYFSVDRHWRLTFLNLALMRLIGSLRGPLERDALVGQPISAAFPPAEHTGFRARYAEAVAEQRPAVFEEYYPPFDKWFEMRVWPTSEGMSVYARDISARKHEEADQARDRRLESIGLLAAGIAHDFNNLLTAIQGNLALARREGADREARIDAADAACNRATELSRRMLTFARGGAPKKRAADVGAALRESAAFVLQGSPVRVDFDIPEGLRHADADPAQLGQVAQNLLLNALQAMPEGGTVRVAAADVEEGVAFTVADTGPGIADEHLPHLFDPFFTTKPSGTGLGLATAWSIVRRHGGTLEVASTSPTGTTLRVVLPAAIERPEPEMRPMPAPRRAGRVLVMDDEEAVRDVITGCLGELGYTAEAVSTGADAIARFEAARAAGHPFDAVVLDLTVPGGIGGLAVLEALRRIEPAVVAIVASGYSDGSVLSDPSAHGFAAALPKPFSLEDLGRALAAAGV